jgi:glycosyltransferase involved in cell wall biosynthesis
MRVCFLTERMLLGYGVDLFVDRLAEGLSREGGFETTVCCNVHDDTFLGQSYEIHHERYKRSLLSPRRTEENAWNALRSFVEDFDVVLACTFPYYYVASRAGKPWIAIDFGVVPPRFYRGRVRRELEYHKRSHYIQCYPEASEVICISDYLRQQLPENLRKSARVIYPGVDHYPRSSLCDIKKLFNIKGLLLMYAGRSMDFSPYKNTSSLLRVVREIQDSSEGARLLISTSCGGEEKSRLEQTGALVLNGVTMEFMPSIYDSADIYLTATQWEGFDLPLLEASYFGLPVVAYKIGAHPEIVQDGRTGYLALNEEEFAAYVSKLVADPELRSELGSNGRQFAASNFPWSKAIDQYAKILSDLK